MKQDNGTIPPTMLCEKSVARLLSLSPRTLRNWRVTGDGPRYIRISSRCIRYRPEDVEAWANARALSNTAQA